MKRLRDLERERDFNEQSDLSERSDFDNGIKKLCVLCVNLCELRG
jgi:hypothetical protein